MAWLIQANVEWNSTDVHLKESNKEKDLTVIANGSSAWSANPNFGEKKLYNALGFGHLPQGGGYKMQKSEEGCLIGMIGTSTNYLFAFNRKEVKILANGDISLTIKLPGVLKGELFLGINDTTAGIGDNAGFIEIKEINIKY